MSVVYFVLMRGMYCINNPKSVIRDFSSKKSDYSRLFHRYSIYILTQYASFILFQDKMKAKFSNDRFGLKVTALSILHLANLKPHQQNKECLHWHHVSIQLLVLAM